MKMAKESDGNSNDQHASPELTEKDLYLKLMELVARRDLTRKQLREVLDFVDKISSGRDTGAGR